MPDNHPIDIEQLHNQILDILRRFPSGLSEYKLFSELAQSGHTSFSKSAFANEHTLFCQHFLLFNALYRLRNELLSKQVYVLEISPLLIRLLGYTPGTASLVEHDPLRDYYLDIRELEKISAVQVQGLLGQFWASYHRQQGRSSALQVLGLSDPVDATTIRRRYRQLAMQHHPDRGGDSESFQQITAAMRLLEPGLS